VVAGEATFTIKCYSQIPKTHASVVASEPFEVGGHNWVSLSNQYTVASQQLLLL
jgi:hypothetical protein